MYMYIYKRPQDDYDTGVTDIGYAVLCEGVSEGVGLCRAADNK